MPDNILLFFCTHLPISTHTPLAGRDSSSGKNSIMLARFLLTRPLRDVTSEKSRSARDFLFLLTRPLRDVTFYALCFFPCFFISTHTPLAGRDHLSSPFPSGFWPISTHTPLAGRDGILTLNSERTEHFYSHAPCGT